MGTNASAATVGSTSTSNHVARWLFTGAFVAGTFDITYATTYSYLRSGVAPSRILQSVASGVLGADAFTGGAATAAFGLALHYLNAFIITCIFFAIASQWRALVRKPLLTGTFYGIIIYAVMNYVVIPFSRVPARKPPATMTWATGLIVHMFFIGVPMALAAKRAFEPESR